MNDDAISSALRTLGEKDRRATPSPELEVRLRQAFRRKHRANRRRMRVVWTVSALAATAGAVAIMIASSHSPRPKTWPKPLVAVPQPEASIRAPGLAASAPRKRLRPKTPPRAEVVTEFFPLMDFPPPLERGELIRVELPAANLRTVGLPVDEDHLADRVQADVLVGQEGLPRAIRFVKSSQ